MRETNKPIFNENYFKFIIIAPNGYEYSKVIEVFELNDSFKHERPDINYISKYGIVNNNNILCVKSFKGTISTAICVQHILRYYSPEFLLIVGTAASIKRPTNDNHINLGDIVISSSITSYEDIEVHHDHYEKAPSRNDMFCDNYLYDESRDIRKINKDYSNRYIEEFRLKHPFQNESVAKPYIPKIFDGHFLSGSHLIDHYKMFKIIKYMITNNPLYNALEMESSGAVNCLNTRKYFKLKIPDFFMIRCITDCIDNDYDKNKDNSCSPYQNDFITNILKIVNSVNISAIASNEQLRYKMQIYASTIAAHFAYCLINNFDHGTA